MPDRDDWKRTEKKPEEPERKDCGCGFGRSCITHQKHHWAPQHFEDAYPGGAPRRYTLTEIKWMRDNPGEPPPHLNKPQYPDHWADK